MKIHYVFSFARHFYRELFKEYFECELINPCNEEQLKRVDTSKNIIFLFADRFTLNFIDKNIFSGTNIMFFRRHELYDKNIELITRNRHKIKHFFTLNSFFQEKLNDNYGINSILEKNYLNENIWTYKERCIGSNVAWTGEFQDRKAPDFLVEIAAAFPDHKFHCAVSPGPAKQLYKDFLSYYKLNNLILYENIDSQEKMNIFLDDKNYLLTTSISEGLPNNVLEAMVKGIKPIVRNYPGNVFQEYSYNSTQDINKLFNGSYNSKEYRDVTIERYGLNAFLKFRDYVLSI